jgi:hypothetical protein
MNRQSSLFSHRETLISVAESCREIAWLRCSQTPYGELGYFLVSPSGISPANDRVDPLTSIRGEQ